MWERPKLLYTMRSQICFLNEFGEQLEKLKEDLYGSNGNEGVDKNRVPFGYLLLARIMLTNRKNLYGPSVQAECNTLGPMLGFGSFAVVFESKGGEDKVIKLSRIGRRLSREAKTLKLLKRVHHEHCL